RAEQPPARKAEPEPVEPEAVAAATEDEPELPEGAAAKKVAVKKRD
ncbi:MAG: hypothetical protein H6705_13525, partial [Myxococcales bacterium]|nr:hypothetical protein [Myxococcales bacterium]